MDGRQKPDPQPENENELNDEQVIDLTQIVEGGDDNDVIDLTDILEAPDQALDAVVEPEEAVIPLVDAIPTEASVDVKNDTDDEIIDLTEVTSAPKTPAVEPIAESASVFSEDDVDEEVIDLMDVATTPEAGTAGTGMPAPDTMPDETDETVPEDEPVIDLLDAMEPQTAEAGKTVDTDDEFSDLESRAEAVLTDAGNAFDIETPEEAAETAGPDSDFMIVEENQAIIGDVDDQPENTPDISESVAAPLIVPASPSEPVPLTEAQIEAALERTIEKIYGEKIEQLMISTIEKTVTREIARIKNALLEDDDMVG